MQDEIWKDVVGYDGLYQVSNCGNVFSVRSNKQLKLRTNIDGYYTVCLSKYGVSKTWRVHRLVAMAFIPNTDNKPCINHIDCNRQNNVISNIEWCTIKENAQHAAKLGRIKGRLGMPHTEETKQKIANKKIGTKQSAETIAKKIANTKYKPRTEAQKKAVGEKNRLHGKKVIDTRTNNTYPTIRICEKELGITEYEAYKELRNINGYLKYV